MKDLKQLVGRLAESFLPAAVNNRNFFVNDIPADLPIEENPDCVASVVSGMLSSLLQFSQDTCIHLSAKRYGYVVVLEMRESGRSMLNQVIASLKQPQALAEKIGGCLTVGMQPNQLTSISFSFPNFPLAAYTRQQPPPFR